jgi:predicted SAM-dependent methyltransferase
MRNLLLFILSHQTLANLRWDFHMIKVRFANWIFGSDNKLRSFVRARTSPVYLNLGSGPRGLDGSNWVNVDAFPDTNVHFLLDFNRTMPFEDQTLDGVFCEHVVEHFTFEDGRRMLGEICRALKVGGVVRIIVPDAAWVMRTYFDQPDLLVRHRLGEAVNGADSQEPMEIVNQYFRQRYEHHFLYDFASMEKMLKLAGFSEVKQLTFKQSAMCPDLVLDHPKYQIESLYVEARK